MINLKNIVDYIDLKLETDVLYGVEKLDTKVELRTEQYKITPAINMIDKSPIYKELLGEYTENIFIKGIYENSFYNCLLTLIVENYDSYTEQEQKEHCSQFVEHISGQLYLHKKKYRELNWKISDIVSDLKRNILSNKIIQVIIDLFHINLFVLDITTFSLDCYFTYETNNNFNMFNRSYFMKKDYDKNIFYEPIIFSNNNYLSMPHPILSKILENKFLVNWVKAEKNKKRKTDIKETVLNFIPENICFKGNYPKKTFLISKPLTTNLFILNYLLDKKNNI